MFKVEEHEDQLLVKSLCGCTTARIKSVTIKIRLSDQKKRDCKTFLSLLGYQICRWVKDNKSQQMK